MSIITILQTYIFATGANASTLTKNNFPPIQCNGSNSHYYYYDSAKLIDGYF